MPSDTTLRATLRSVFIPMPDGTRLAADVFLPAGLATALGALVIPVDGLPAGVTVTDTAVVAGGVRATLTGSGVALTDLVGRSAG